MMSLERARAIARMMDNAVRIPGTNIRVGLDALLGLFPGLGDVSGAVFGGYIVLLAARLGVSPVVVSRMLLNLGLDMATGAVPLLGDLVDVAWKANTRNLALLERAIETPAATRKRSVAVIAGAVAALGALAVGGAVVTVWALVKLIGALT